jgi:hypothetical protein
MTENENRRSARELQLIRQDSIDKGLVVALPERVMARLQILAEDSDIARVISDAVMTLWEQYYRKPDFTSGETEKGEVVPEPQEHDKRAKVQELHAKGIPMEDIAVELDWPLESVRAALGIKEPVSEPALVVDRESVARRVKALHDKGISFTEIAKRLNAEVIPTLSGSGKWHHGSVKRLLQD